MEPPQRRKGKKKMDRSECRLRQPRPNSPKPKLKPKKPSEGSKITVQHAQHAHHPGATLPVNPKPQPYARLSPAMSPGLMSKCFDRVHVLPSYFKIEGLFEMPLRLPSILTIYFTRSLHVSTAHHTGVSAAHSITWYTLLLSACSSDYPIRHTAHRGMHYICWATSVRYAARLINLLCRAVPCCAVPCCAVLCCAVLCCAVLCGAVRCGAVRCGAERAVLCCAVLCCAVLSVLCCAVLCCS